MIKAKHIYIKVLKSNYIKQNRYKRKMNVKADIP